MRVVLLFYTLFLRFFSGKGNYASKIRALLFDLNGTLIDIGELHYEATVKALKALGGSIDRQTYDQNIHGITTPTLP